MQYYIYGTLNFSLLHNNNIFSRVSINVFGGRVSRFLTAGTLQVGVGDR